MHAPTPYSAVFLLHTPAPIKIDFGAVRCGAVRCGAVLAVVSVKLTPLKLTNETQTMLSFSRIFKFNAVICLNSIKEPNVPNLRNCI